jgi:hypothetical protein
VICGILEVQGMEVEVCTNLDCEFASAHTLIPN